MMSCSVHMATTIPTCSSRVKVPYKPVQPKPQIGPAMMVMKTAVQNNKAEICCFNNKYR